MNQQRREFVLKKTSTNKDQTHFGKVLTRHASHLILRWSLFILLFTSCQVRVVLCLFSVFQALINSIIVSAPHSILDCAILIAVIV